MAKGVMLWALIVTLFALSGADVTKRKVETLLYPDCADYQICKEASENATASNTSFPNVVYVRSTARDDVLHFVMTTINLPSILVVHTVGDAAERLNFNWTRLLSNNTVDMDGAIYTNGSLYHGSVLYSFAITFSRLIEYNDIHDSANLENAGRDNKTQWNIRDFSEFVWMNMTLGQGGNSVIFNTTKPQLAPYVNHTAGSMYFEFTFNNDSGRDSELPSLKYNANNTQMDFVLDNYVPKFNKSRFALEMTVVANYSSQAMDVEVFKSIDDEYSPGVFRVVNWYSAGKSHNRGYIQWKPVCYLASKRARGVGTEVMKYPLQKPKSVPGLEGLLAESLARAFFGAALNNTSKVVQMSSNVSFGLSQDGFYPKSNYTAWTVTVGYGKPPVEGISLMVIIIIAAGLGIPVIIILLGGIYVCARKRRNGYEEIDGSVSRNNPRMN